MEIYQWSGTPNAQKVDPYVVYFDLDNNERKRTTTRIIVSSANYVWQDRDNHWKLTDSDITTFLENICKIDNTPYGCLGLKSQE